MHRDLKLENMLMVNQEDPCPVKIADFGLSKFFNPGSVLSTMCGSPQYVAPEILGISDGAQVIFKAAECTCNLHSRSWYSVSLPASLWQARCMSLAAGAS